MSNVGKVEGQVRERLLGVIDHTLAYGLFYLALGAIPAVAVWLSSSTVLMCWFIGIVCQSVASVIYFEVAKRNLGNIKPISSADLLKHGIIFGFLGVLVFSLYAPFHDTEQSTIGAEEARAIAAFLEDQSGSREDAIRDLAEAISRLKGPNVRFEAYVMQDDRLVVVDGGFNGFGSSFRNREFGLDAAPSDAGLAGYVYSKSEPLVVPNVDQIPPDAEYKFKKFDDDADRIVGPTRSLVLAPIRARFAIEELTTIGVVCLSSSEVGAFTDDDVALLEVAGAALVRCLLPTDSSKGKAL
ncbi:MAG TPA: hypothetical protein DDW52_24650 [Planctomycetaceae bacterium]|nr:hypothetical protein [Planctomycetaceae bacterium]